MARKDGTPHRTNPNQRRRRGKGSLPAKAKQFCLNGHNTHITGRMSKNGCKVCHADFTRFKKYGLTPETYAQMLEDTHGICTICQRVMDKPAVDHDHVTGEVRGIICFTCNHSLGHFLDNSHILRRAADYLDDRL